MTRRDMARESLCQALRPTNSFDADLLGARVRNGNNDVVCFLCPNDAMKAMLAFTDQELERAARVAEYWTPEHRMGGPATANEACPDIAQRIRSMMEE